MPHSSATAPSASFELAQQTVPGATFRTYQLSGATISSFELDLNVNPQLRVVPYYDGQRRGIESAIGRPSWRQEYGADALAIMSGTFFNQESGGRIPFGRVIGGALDFDPENLNDWPPNILEPQRHIAINGRRCFLAWRNDRYIINSMRPGIPMSFLKSEAPLLLGGGGWLILGGFEAIAAARASLPPQGQEPITVTVGQAPNTWELMPQGFQADVAGPFNSLYRTLVAVDRAGRRLALAVTTQALWAPIIGFLRGQSAQRLPFPVWTAMFLDGGGTTEMYLRDERPDRRPRNKRDWRPQPTCVMVREE
jgi:hypothetical protein